MTKYKKSRLWCFTNYRLDFDYEKLIKACKVKYIKYGIKKCPTTDRIHHQGMLWLKTQSGSKKNLGKMLGGAHVEMCEGSWDDNDKYVGKDGEVRFHGEAPSQGDRGDIKDNIDNIMAGKLTAEELCITDPEHYHQYGRTLHKAEDIALRRKFRTEMTTCEWLWGPTGVGKSHKAFEDFDPETCYVWKKDMLWQDGYTGQETVIINEYRGEMRLGKLLELVDKWPYYLERRCREPVPFIAKHVIITSSMPPGDVYSNLDAEDKLEQLYRRIVVTKLEASEQEIAQKCSEG